MLKVEEMSDCSETHIHVSAQRVVAKLEKLGFLLQPRLSKQTELSYCEGPSHTHRTGATRDSVFRLRIRQGIELLTFQLAGDLLYLLSRSCHGACTTVSASCNPACGSVVMWLTVLECDESDREAERGQCCVDSWNKHRSSRSLCFISLGAHSTRITSQDMFTHITPWRQMTSLPYQDREEVESMWCDCVYSCMSPHTHTEPWKQIMTLHH